MRLIDKLDRYLEDRDYEIIIKDGSVNVINFDEVIDFSSNKISCRCNNKIIIIEGRNLIISKMVDLELLVNGIIFDVRIN